jgi:hypothetical protein
MRRSHRILLLVAALLAPGAAARAQIPDTFTNLQVLPKTIPRDSLIGIMRSFSLGLGVRCQYCHVGGDGVSFEGVRFADDDDVHKRKARAMLRMVATINDEFLAGLPERTTPPIRVQCVTCHGGIAQPRTIEDVLAETVRSAGADSAVAHYRRLRDAYHGTAAYDFAPLRLMELAGTLAAEHRLPEAVRMLELDIEFNPGNADIHRQLGEVQLMRADTAAAIAAFERVLELQPNNGQVRRRLAQIRR